MSRPDEETFAVNTVDLRQPTQFLHLNDMVKGTNLKVTKFKEIIQQTQFGPKDVSELTITNTETGEEIVLPLEKTVNSPESSAKFYFNWRNSKEMIVKKNGKFSLDPEPNVEYKLIDINSNEALIENLTSGERIKIPLRK
jgi:hypothetical protein